MIEKWRPAKAGDSGFIRKRDGLTQNWRFDVCNSIEEAAFGFYVDGFCWLYCEVLEAYMSDEEVERLADGLSMRIDCVRDHDDLYADAIRQHFASEEGGAND